MKGMLLKINENVRDEKIMKNERVKEKVIADDKNNVSMKVK